MDVYAVVKYYGSITDRSETIVGMFDSMEKAKEYVEQNMLKPTEPEDTWCCYYETPYNGIYIARYKVQ